MLVVATVFETEKQPLRRGTRADRIRNDVPTDALVLLVVNYLRGRLPHRVLRSTASAVPVLSPDIALYLASYTSKYRVNNNGCTRYSWILPILRRVLRVVGATLAQLYQVSDLITVCRAKAIPDEVDRGPLRAMISYGALVDPAHPLRKPGADGIELYIGEISCATSYIACI